MKDRPIKGLPAAGFSLVEVVISLGIITFALVALLGIASVGATASLESKWDTESGQIFEEIVGQLQTKPYSQAQQESADDGEFPLPALDDPQNNTTEFHLDAQGRIATAAEGVRKVRVTVADPVSQNYINEKNAAQPGPPRSQLSLVKVEISPHPPRLGGTVSTYYTEICSLQQ